MNTLNPSNPDSAEFDDNRRRYFDRGMGLHVVNVFQGDYYVTPRKDEVLTTVLGSCISACIRDPMTGYGGMNHFLLPAGNTEQEQSSYSLRYGTFAMEQLINDILSHGGQRERLEIKVFGGGNVVKGLSGVGHKNADFIESFLRNEGLRIAGSDLRGHSPRKIQYLPRSGKVRMRHLDTSLGQKIAEKETGSNIKTQVQEETGTIELFD